MKWRILIYQGKVSLSCVLAFGVFATPGIAEDALDFDIGFLQFSDKAESTSFNLDYFAKSGGMFPGEYDVTVYVNDKKVDQRSVTFVASERDPGVLQAVITPELLEAWGIVPDEQRQLQDATVTGNPPSELTTLDTQTSVEEVATTTPVEITEGTPTAPATEAMSKEGLSGTFARLSHWVPGAKETFNYQDGSLKIVVPQAYVAPPGWLRTPASTWNHGVPALMVNYDYSGSSMNNKADGTYRFDFLNLSGLLNVMGWRLRNDMNYTTSSTGHSKWNVLNTYLQHDYSFWQGGQFTVGQTSTDGNILESVPFEGVMLQSDDAMLNPDLGGFAPVVSGIANSNAVVSVYQGGALIFQQSVPAGPFEFKDLTRNYNGDMEVEIREADGTIRRFTQASAQVPILVRQGRTYYNLAAGRYHMDGQTDNGMSKEFASGSLAWGATGSTTLYTGSIMSKDYASVSLGVGQYMPVLGAISADIVYSNARFPGNYGNKQGQAYRVSYSRAFEDTSLNLMAYRYATSDYYTYSDALQVDRKTFVAGDDGNRKHQRSRFQVSLSQGMGDYGSLSLSGSRDDYWNQSGYSENWSASYSKSIKGVSFSVAGGINRSPDNGTDKTFSLTMSTTLGDWFGSRNTSVNYSMTGYNSNVQNNVGLNGSFMEDNRLNYSLSQGWGNQGQSENTNGNLSYNATYGNMNAGYGRQRDSWQTNYGLSGGVVLHSGGATLSQPLSFESAMALVEIPGASGVDVAHGNIQTDWFGNAVVPNLIPYARNEVSVNVASLPENVEIRNNNAVLIPSKGALVKVPFDAEVGRRVLLKMLHQGKPLPFGTMVTVNTKGATRSGIVAEKGKVYLSGLANTGTVVAQWGQYDDERCEGDFTLPEEDGTFTEETVQCQ